MMEQNNSKKILLSVLGVAILIVAVVGVSFAALSFERTTSSANTIATGTISMSYAEATRGIELKDAMPMTDTEGKAMITEATTADGQQEYFDFSVSTTVKDAMVIDYTITVSPQTITPSSTIVGGLADSQVKVYLETSSDGSTYTQDVAPVLVSNLTSVTTGSRSGSYVLKTSQHSHSASGTLTTYYRMRIWVDQNVYAGNNSTTGDTDTDNTGLTRADGKVYTYKLLVNVDGTADIMGTGSNS